MKKPEKIENSRFIQIQRESFSRPFEKSDLSLLGRFF
jgi:hypothetical protein